MIGSLIFVGTSIALGVGLAMDATTVSMANGLNEPHMKAHKFVEICGCYAIFQFLMPMIGWLCVHTIVTYFTAFQKFIPWIALILLAYIGGKMVIDGIHSKNQETVEERKLGHADLLLQGIATSIDALSVGFTIADYGLREAVVCSLIVAIVTFFMCAGGLFIGRKFGTILAGRASILGGIILIAIGIEIFVQGMLGDSVLTALLKPVLFLAG